ncbi:hypothetical protein ACGFI3_24735 [Nonomuraea wenchangensis]|uniref:hypothetical protein n=1 Tax=Nonomuraea wenchangensis TaxID=568860 RepID=UPI00371C1477
MVRSDWQTWAIFAPPLITATIRGDIGLGSAVWLIAGLTALDELIQRIQSCTTLLVDSRGVGWFVI